MAAEEPQQQKQEPLGSDSEGTDLGWAVHPGLVGAMPGCWCPRRPGAERPEAGARRTVGPFLFHPCRRLPSPSQWKELLPRPPARLAERARATALLPRALPGRGLSRPAPSQPPRRRAPRSKARLPRWLQSGLSLCRGSVTCPPSPEQPAPVRASCYSGLRSTKDWAAAGDAAGVRGCEWPRACAPEYRSLRFRGSPLFWPCSLFPPAWALFSSTPEELALSKWCHSLFSPTS